MKYCPVCESDYPDDVTVCPLDGGIVRRPGERPDPFIGKVIRGRYRVERRLGEGGMGTVYLAEQLSIGRKVALKVLRSDFNHDDGFVARFRQEAKLVAALNDARNPHVTLVHDFDQAEDGSLFIVMEWLEGEGLNDVIRREGALPLGRAVRLAAQIAQGLEAAHRRGVIHRDIKPHNIMVLSATDDIKLMDFGIARLRDSTDAPLTRVGTMMGTPDYMAPEQIEGHDVTDRTDIYAFGIVFYEMLTGTVPFRASTPAAVLTRQLREEPPPPRGLRPDIPAEAEALILRALRKNPEERQRDMGEITRALDQLARRLGDAPEESHSYEARTVITDAMPSSQPTSAMPPPPSATATRADSEREPSTTWAPAGDRTIAPSAHRSAPPAAATLWGPAPVSEATIVTDASSVATHAASGRTTAPRSRRTFVIAGAAAAVIIVGVVGLWAYLGSSSAPPSGPSASTAASAAAPVTSTGEQSVAVAPSPAPVAPATTPATGTSRQEIVGALRPPAPAAPAAVPPTTVAPAPRPTAPRPPRPAGPTERPASSGAVETRPPAVSTPSQERIQVSPPVVASRPAPATPSAEVLRAQVEDRLRGRGLLRGSGDDPDSGVVVEVTPDRTVTLHGIVRDSDQREEAVRLARLSGVSDVRSRINVQQSWK